MRRGVGLRGLQQRAETQERFASQGEKMAELQLTQITEQLAVFKTNLELFATRHKKEIRKNPEFRHDFQQMCQQIGVDPLASQKGFWSELLGINDFYYELGVQIAEVCLATRAQNGGLVDLSGALIVAMRCVANAQRPELLESVRQRRGQASQEIVIDDLERAIKKLHVLGSGFQVLRVGGRAVLQSVPTELNNDHVAVLAHVARLGGHSGGAALADALRWPRARVDAAMDQLLQDGMAWVDDQDADGQRAFWFPGLWSKPLMLSAPDL